MKQMIALMQERLNPDAIYIMFELTNHTAQRFYESLGFRDTGLIEDDERVYKLELTNGR